MRAHQLRSIKAALILLVGLCCERAAAQCSGIASNPAEASACTSRAIPDPKVTIIDRPHAYSLAELIDIGERNHPTTRTTWERAKQQAKLLGLEKSEYFPVLAATVLFADQRVAQPFPKPLSPMCYSVIDLPLVQPQLELNTSYWISEDARLAWTPRKPRQSRQGHDLSRPTRRVWLSYWTLTVKPRGQAYVAGEV
jgi:hypothetical protein